MVLLFVPRCSRYTCIGPLLLTKNTTDGNAWARCSSRDAAKALIWAHRCCRMNLLMDTKRPTTSPGRCCRYPRMGPSFLPKILLMVLLLSLRCSWYPCMSLLLLPKIPPMAMNGPTVRPEMLPKHSHRPILLPKELLMVTKRSNNSSERCCRYSGMGPLLLPKILLMILNGPTVLSEISRYPCMSPLLLAKIPPTAMNGPTILPKMLPKHSYGPIVAAERTCRWSRRGPPILPRCCRNPRMGPSLLPKILPAILNGPAVFSEMLPVFLHEPIVADKKYH